MQRVIVGLDPDADWEQVGDALRAAGAETVDPPRESLPDVIVASYPDETPIEVAVEAAVAICGVAYAEPDTLRFALESDSADSDSADRDSAGSES
jgi:hypothetical protein